MLDTSDAHKPIARPLWTRLYQRLMDWLWFGPLTRDLRPARPPSSLSVAFALLADICRSGRAFILSGLQAPSTLQSQEDSHEDSLTCY